MQEGSRAVHAAIAMAPFAICVAVAFYFLVFGIVRAIQWLSD
jgi:hypothetical protein